MAGQVYRFLTKITEGDTVVTGDPSRRLYFVGRVESAAELHADAALGLRRRVTWQSEVSRDALKVATRNTLGAIQSLFKLSAEALDDLLANARPIGSSDSSEAGPEPGESTEEAKASLEDLREEVIEKSREFIEDMIAKLDADELERLVAGILRGMGYKARVTAKGPDRGVDVFASPDGLGLQEPRIFAEVKHRKARTAAQEVRSFLGGRQSGDRCLYVSTGGFTKDARYEADRANVPLTLIDLPRLRELLVEHYASVDIETKQLVPLMQLYWPLDQES